MLKLSANSYWKFYRGTPPRGRVINSENPHDHGLEVCDVRYDDSEWETVHLPHTVREERLNCSGGYNYLGECWYRKQFTVEKEWENKVKFFDVGGAMQRMDVWIDGKPQGVYYGGFLPHLIDVSNLDEGEHVIVIKLDNSDCFDIPPGKPQGDLDFCYFGGLYRNVWFCVAEKLHFTDAVHQNKVASGGLFVRYPLVSKEKAVVKVKAHAVNENDSNINGKVVLLLDGEKVLEQKAEFDANAEWERDFEFSIANPRLWSPHNPSLYTVTAQIVVDGKVVDEISERVGIREIRFEQNGIVINGEKQFINGVNRHQEYPYVGFALPDSTQYRDLKLLRDMGTLCIRIAHYPPSREFMNYCDELGILCIIPTPGWQIHPSSIEFDRRSCENTRRMVRLHRNHPSVMAWEPILNETDYPEYFALEQIRCVKEECADGQCIYGCDRQSRCAELFPLHFQPGNELGIPAFIREYGDSYTEQYGVATTTYRVRRGKNVSFYAGGEAPMLWSANKRFERYKKFIDDGNVCGGCVWVGIDHNRGYDLTECAGGILDFFRLKKYAYNMFESQQDIDKAGAKCFIASNWDKESSTDITVYTNAEKVRLLRNGEEMGVLETLGKAGLHPPVTFKNVEFIAGELVAEAIVNNEVVAKSVVRTHENATKLVLTPHFEGVNEWKADGADLLMVRVSAIDKNGVLDVSYEGEIEFFVEGDATIVGEGKSWVKANPIVAEAGMSAVVLRAGVKSGKVRLKAVARGLETAEIELVTIDNSQAVLPCKKYEKLDVIPSYVADEKEVFSIPESVRMVQTKNWSIGTEKPVCASSCAEGKHAENANRKEMGEPWIAGDSTLPQWWACDLDDEYNINAVFVGWQKDGVWYNYDIEVSLDGVNYTKIVQNSASGQTRKPDKFPANTKARFVRVFVRSASTADPVGIYQVQIFGKRDGE